jgi:hypothetical protein
MKVIYSSNFILKLKEELGDYKKFIKSNIKNRKKVSEKIKKIFLYEDFSKCFSEKNIKQSSIILNKILYKESELFHNSLKYHFSYKIKRKNSADLKTKFLLVINEIKILIEKHLKLEINADTQDVFSYIKEEDVFYLIIISILSKIKTKNSISDIWIDIDNNEDYEISISSIDFYYSLNKTLVYYIINIIIKNFYNYEKDNELIEIFRNIKINEIYFLNINSISYLLKQLELITEKTVFKSSFKSKDLDSNHINKIYTLPKILDEYKPVVAHLPEIIEPSGWNNEDFIDNIEFSKKIKNGLSMINYSLRTISSLEISQKKKMIISENAINLFKELNNINVDEYNLLDISPIIPIKVLNQQKDIVKQTKIDLIDSKTYSKIKEIKTKIYQNLNRSNFNLKKEEFLNEIFINLKITEDMYLKNNSAIIERKKLKIMESQKEIFDSILLMAEIFKGFPIYFLNTVDYRLRIYPWSFLFARTTGVYKYLLKDYKAEKLDDLGLYNMVEAYYSKDSNLSDKYSKIEKNKISIINFFNENKIDLKKTKNYIYFKLLEIEINDAINNNFKTNFMIEVDQKSSSSVFLSIVLKNKKLAEKSNLIGDNNINIPEYLTEKTSNFLKRNKIYSENIITLFKNNRKLHKYSFMTFCYNQTGWGRINELLNKINDNLSESDNQILHTFSYKYEDFLNEIFPKLTKQRNKLNEIVKIIIKDTNFVLLKTLDGSVIKWKILKKVDKIDKFKDPYDDKNFISFRKKQLLFDKIDNRKMITSFIPGFIHSIDGAVMRMLISEMSKNNYIINHVHDSIMLHPNYLNKLYEIIKNIYLDKEITNNLVENMFIKPNIELLNEDNKIKVLKIFDEFKSLEDNFDINNINTRNLYPFE